MTKSVTFEQVQSLVDSLEFVFTHPEGTTATQCLAKLPSGFVVGQGFSACVDPALYNKAEGEKWAKEKCIKHATDELWKLEAYVLSKSMATTHVERIIAEKKELDERLDKLYAFFESDSLAKVPLDEQTLMREQADIMASYSCVLEERLKLTK